MAKGRCYTKSKKSENTPVSKKSTGKHADKSVPQDHVKCFECGCNIADDTKALNCEKCGKVWKCSTCVGIRSSTYEDLVSEAGKELHWFCEPCYEVVLHPDRDDKVMEILNKLTDQLISLEEKLDRKVDNARVDAIEQMVKSLEIKVSEGYNGVVKSLEQSKSDVTAVLEKSKFDVTAVQGCVEGVLRVQSREEKEEEVKRREEEEDKNKRKSNIIIYGLPEPTATQSEDRRKEDSDLTLELLHALSCDDISVNHMTRLGPPKTESDLNPQPRPVKLDLTSEEARNVLLKKAKNLRKFPNEKWRNVFIHQDLTPREREARRALVQELKMRKSAGEQNLIIVNNKIVKKIDFVY